MKAAALAKEPTQVSRVEDVLRAADDFILPSAIQAATGLKPNDVRCALVHLYRYKAASFMEEGGKTYWFATPETDARTRKVELRIHEGECARGGKPRKHENPTDMVRTHSGPKRQREIAASITPLDAGAGE